MKLKKGRKKGQEEGRFEHAFGTTLVDFPLLFTKLQTQIFFGRLIEMI